MKKSDSDENLKKNTVLGKVINNIQPVGVRTRATTAAAAAVIKQQHKASQITAKKSNENVQKPELLQPATTTDLLTVLKARHNELTTKPQTKTRRISNEFEKTEESLYVSALEDISNDASLRLSDISRKISDVGVAKKSSKHSHDVTLKPDSQDIFEDAQDIDTDDRKMPPGVSDFDRENWNDPYQVSHYTMDIFDYLTQQEIKYQVRDYINDQPELSKWMRSLLIDWMVEVQESFELNHETLYLAVKIVDTYLGKERVSKDSLQLVGAAALLIACKYDVSKIA